MSVSAPATRPPVQDSAVAMVSFRIRQRSSSERERARASLPLMSIAPARDVAIPVIPRQADGGGRGRRDAFLAAGKAELFAGGRLDGDARNIQPADIGDPCAHGVAKRSDFRALADQRDLEMGDTPAARGDPVHRIFQETIRRGALPLGVGWREMRTDIAV